MLHHMKANRSRVQVHTVHSFLNLSLSNCICDNRMTMHVFVWRLDLPVHLDDGEVMTKTGIHVYCC